MDRVITSTLLQRSNIGLYKKPAYTTTGEMEFDALLERLAREVPYLNVIRIAQCSAVVYYEEDDITAGRITLADMRRYRGVNSLAMTYNVFAPAIENKKYGEDNDLYRSMSTASPDKAIMLIKKYIRRPNMRQATLVARDAFSRQGTARLQDKQREFSNALRELGINSSTSIAFEAMKTALEAGVLSAAVEDSMQYAVHLHAQAEALRWDKRTVYAVQLRGHADMMVAEYGRMTTAACNSTWAITEDPFVGPTHVVEVSALPEDITARMAALTIVDSKQYVEDVGMRVGDRMFYVIL